MMKTLIFSFIFIVSGVISTYANAASSISMTLEELTANADDIVVARCVDVQTRWLGKKIVTDTTIDISQQLKGDDKAQLIVTTLGGSAIHPRLKTKVNMYVPGNIRFNIDEEVLVFTKQNKAGDNQVIGLSQGKFILEHDTVSGEKLISVGQKKLTTQQNNDNPLASLFSLDAEFHTEDSRISTRKIRLSELIRDIEQHLSLAQQ
ncbi:hypothetical protein [Agarilytica rhodophyticola]|uniref:hypothetical protein n=1 Tax=Agarilytica rhodophyticola TaxID=1737490 RepID=UPI000B347FF7|nr:hypothetical protein [Agarilytica rhodophyticola]